MMNLIRQFTGSLVASGFIAGFVAFFLVVAWLGIDFGEHYDEWYVIGGLKQSIEQLDGFHQHYTYSGLYFLPGFVLLVVDAWSLVGPALDALAGYPERPVNLMAHDEVLALQEAMRAALNETGFLVDLRMTFAALSSLAIVWIYLAGRALMPDGRVAPVLGAAFVALSWEVGYHARFVAPDAMLMQFAALQLFLLARLSRADSGAAAVAWALLAAAIGGLGMGVKLTGVFLWLPVAFMLAFPQGSMKRFNWRQRLALVSATGVLLLAVFLVTTPGALWDPLRFIGHIYFEILNYTRLPDAHPYHVVDMAERIWIYIVWLTSAVPSPWTIPALALTVVVCLGGLWLIRNDRMLLLAILAFAAIYLWFVARHPGVYVRNGLILVPMLALMFAAGCRFVGNIAMAKAALFWPVALIALGIGLANAYWLYSTAMSIRTEDGSAFVSALRDYVAEQDDRPVWISPDLDIALAEQPGPAVSCGQVGVGALDGDQAAAFYRERPWSAWPANRPGYVTHVFSSHEVNYNYAPSWRGRHEANRIVVLDVVHAAEAGFDLTTFRPCRSAGG